MKHIMHPTHRREVQEAVGHDSIAPNSHDIRNCLCVVVARFLFGGGGMLGSVRYVVCLRGSDNDEGAIKDRV